MMNSDECPAAIISRQTKPHAGSDALITGQTPASRLRTFPLYCLSQFQAFHNHQAIVRHSPQLQLSTHKPFGQCFRRPPAPNVTLLCQCQVHQPRLNVKTEAVCNVLFLAGLHAWMRAVRLPTHGTSPATQGQGRDVPRQGQIPATNER